MIADCLEIGGSSRDARAVVGSVIVLALGLGACASDDAPSTAPLPADSLIAACLTAEPGAPAAESKITVDLCAVDAEGASTTIRSDIDAGVPVGLSPSRTRIAFVAGGGIRTIGVDGSEEDDLGITGSSPEWVGGDTIAYIGEALTTVEAVELGGTGRPRLVDLGDLQLPEGDWRLDSFAMDPDGAQIVAALSDGQGTVTDVDDDRFLLVRTSVGRGDVGRVLLGPTTDSIVYPDVSPAGQIIVANERGLELVDPTDGTTEQITTTGRLATTPVWSEDGERIAWVGDGPPFADGASHLFVGDLEGSDISGPSALASDRHRPLKAFPAFPDW